MKITKQRIRLLLIIAQVFLWVVVIGSVIGNNEITTQIVKGVDAPSIVEIIWLFLPIIFLLNFNWYFLAPRFLRKGKYIRYSLYVLLSIIGSAFLLALNTQFVNENEMWLITGTGSKFLIPGILTMSYMAAIAYLLSMPFYLSLGWFDQQSKIDKLASENLRSELSILKDQINPHFFFNTLNNLYSLTLTNSEKASEAILKLSGLMRYVIYDAKKSFVSIREEVEYLENYFEIQQMRIGNKAKISFTHTMDDPSTKVVPLLFINLLENAFKHGTDSMVKDGYIDCSLMMVDRCLKFEVKNAYEMGMAKAGGVGLTNLKRRLELIYPERHVLTITDDDSSFYVSLIIEKTDELSNSR